MKRKAKLKSTGETVEVVSANLGRARVKYIERDKVLSRGVEKFETGALRMKELEFSL